MPLPKSVIEVRSGTGQLARDVATLISLRLTGQAGRAASRSDTRLRIRRYLAPPPIMNRLAESSPLLGRHLVPALGHSPPKIGPMHATTMKASEQNPAESQEAESLPEGDLLPAKQSRKQPVPQMQHHFAADGHENRDPQDRQRGYEQDPFLSHVVFLTCS